MRIPHDIMGLCQHDRSRIPRSIAASAARGCTASVTADAWRIWPSSCGGRSATCAVWQRHRSRGPLGGAHGSGERGSSARMPARSAAAPTNCTSTTLTTTGATSLKTTCERSAPPAISRGTGQRKRRTLSAAAPSRLRVTSGCSWCVRRFSKPRQMRPTPLNWKPHSSPFALVTTSPTGWTLPTCTAPTASERQAMASYRSRLRWHLSRLLGSSASGEG